MFLSDRQKLLDELHDIQIYIETNKRWTPELSDMFLRAEVIKNQLKQLGKKDWF